MSDVVCEREFHTTIDDVVRPIKVSWDRPQPYMGDWRCDFRVVWPDGATSPGYTVGIDSAQALILAFYQVSARLETASMPVRWFDYDKNKLGLPSHSREETTGDTP